MNSEALAILGLGLSVVGTAIGVSRWIHGQFADLSRDVDRRIDAMTNELTTLRADFRVHQKDSEGQFIRLDAWTSTNHEAIKQNVARIGSVEKKLKARIADLELFLAKNLSFAVRRDD